MVKLIGMGPGNIKYVTNDAIEKVNASSKLIAFGRIAETVEKIKKPVKRVSKISEITEYINDNDSEDENIVILASGDPCFYGILEYLKKSGVSIDEVVPGISSFQYMMAKLKKSWHGAQLISLHGREDGIARAIDSRISIILTDSINTPDKISQAIFKAMKDGELEMKHSKIYAGFNLSYEDEEIIIKNIGEPIPMVSALSVVVIENEMD